MEDVIDLPGCTHGNLYRIHARNASYGVFDEEIQAFTIARNKFGSDFLFEEYHCDVSLGTVRPLEDLGPVHFSSKKEKLAFLIDLRTMSVEEAKKKRHVQ